MSKQLFASVWDCHWANMKLRSVLMTALKNHITRTEISQAQAAELFGVTQPRVSDLTRGKINLFGLDALVNMATHRRASHRNAGARNRLSQISFAPGGYAWTVSGLRFHAGG